jgi:dTDP-4-amino-4,6-dideoxygalactose transaminase
LEAEHAVAVSSGTDALLLALMALGIGPGDEVVVPAFTFFATAGCVARVGATPVFADVCPVCMNMDTDRAMAVCTSRTRAIMPVHLFGQPAEMTSLHEWTTARGLTLIEDAAQAIGARHHGRMVGGLGTCGCFSFFPTKNLGCLGDGGMMTTQDAALAERARVLRMHGMQPKYHHACIGGNFRMDALQAALLRVKLPHLEGWTNRRRKQADYYATHLLRLPGVRQARPQDCRCRGTASADETARMILPVAYPHHYHVWNQYTLRIRGEGERDALRAHLTARGIGSEIYYPVPLHRQKCFQPNTADCPVADLLAREVLSLPIYPELGPSRQDEVIRALGEFLG